MEEHQYAYSGSGSTATNTGNTYYYDLGGQLLGTWDGSSPTTTFLLTDSLGSVVSSFNNPSSGAVMQGDQLYGPYGNQRLKQGSLSTNKGFTGQYNDGLTGLDYYNARYYDPTIGLFLSADVVQGNMMGMDPYSYVGGNPESRTDPSGNLAYSPETGQVAIPQPDGRDVITGYNAGLNGTFNSKVSYTPVEFTPASFWPKSASSTHVAPSPQGKPHARYNFSTVQGRNACFRDAACSNAMHNIALNNFENFGAQALGWLAIIFDAASSVENPAAPDEVEMEYEELIEKEQLLTEDDQATLDDWACSFTAQTNVSTDTGKQSIGSLKPGERVLAYNPKTHKMELQPILHVWINHDNDLVDLTITTTHVVHGKINTSSREVIHTNKKHPFLTVEKGFLPVGQMKLGMHVVEADGQTGVITGWRIVLGVMTMYNLEVAQDHTFTVGAGQWVVHNACSGGYQQGDETPGGLQFTDHSATSANRRGFTGQIIDNIVRNFRNSRVHQFNATKPLNEQWTWRYQDNRGSVVVTNDPGDEIVTVYSHPPDANGTNYIPNDNGN